MRLLEFKLQKLRKYGTDLDSYPAVPCQAYFGHTTQIDIFSVDSNSSFTMDLHTQWHVEWYRQMAYYSTIHMIYILNQR
jgi:hypothetical protein